MKTPSIILLCLAFALASCQSNSVERTITTTNGATVTTERPVLSPEDAAFHAQCQKTLDTKF